MKLRATRGKLPSALLRCKNTVGFILKVPQKKQAKQKKTQFGKSSEGVKHLEAIG